MNILEIRVAGRYKLGPKIGAAVYGEIYQGKNVQTQQDVAIKMVNDRRHGSLTLITTRKTSEARLLSSFMKPKSYSHYKAALVFQPFIGTVKMVILTHWSLISLGMT